MTHHSPVRLAAATSSAADLDIIFTTYKGQFEALAMATARRTASDSHYNVARSMSAIARADGINTKIKLMRGRVKAKRDHKRRIAATVRWSAVPDAPKSMYVGVR